MYVYFVRAFKRGSLSFKRGLIDKVKSDHAPEESEKELKMLILIFLKELPIS